MDEQTLLPTLKQITLNLDICHWKPIVFGLGYPVEPLLELLTSGMSHNEILADYPHLEQADILALLAYATRLSHIGRTELIATVA